MNEKLEETLKQKEKRMRVYQIWNETSVGPTFSTRKKAEQYLDDDDEDDGRGRSWREFSKSTGYPSIEEILIDDELFDRDR